MMKTTVIAVLLTMALLPRPAFAHPTTDGQIALAEADSLRDLHRRLFHQGRFEDAMTAAERELAIRGSRLVDDDPTAGESLSHLSVYCCEVGQYARADSLANRALTILSPAYSDDARLADALFAKSFVLGWRGLNDESAARGEEALAIYRRTLVESDLRLGTTLRWLGAIENQRGGGIDIAYLEKADAYLDEALAIQRRWHGPAHMEIAMTLTTQALVAKSRGDFETANRLSFEGLDMMRTAAPPSHPRLAEVYYERSMILRRLGELEDALDAISAAADILEQAYERHPNAIECRNLEALLNRDLGRYDRAVALARQNQKDIAAVKGKQITWLYYTANLALCHIYAKNFAIADSLLDQAEARALELAEQGTNTHAVTTITDYRARLAMESSRFEAAESYMKTTLERHLETIPEGHRQIVADYTFIGRAQAGQGNLESADASFGEAVRCFELARQSVGTGTRPATFVRTPYEPRAVVRLELGRFDAAWHDLERARARLLGDALLGESTFTLERVQAALSTTEAIVGWIDYELLPESVHSWAFVIRRTGPVHWERLSIEKTSAEEFAERFKAFREGVAQSGTSAYAAAGPDFTTDAATALWHQRFDALLPHLSGAKTMILIPSGAMAGVPIDVLVDDSGVLLAERFALKQAPSCAVYAWLAERTMNGRSTNIRRGLLVGDPAFSEEHLAKWQPPAEHTVQPSPDIATLRGALRGSESSYDMLPRLPWTRVEVEGVAELIPEATVLLGGEASADRLTQLAGSGDLVRYDVVHVATHALVNVNKPERSALVLARPGLSASETEAAAERSEGRAGTITAGEIERGWKLNAQLVTLSGCETALGRTISGEGTVGFAYPLFVAGTRSLLTTLWPVNDEASALLMQRFYRNWLGDPMSAAGPVTKADALREAKMWLRDWTKDDGQRPYAHPYYWAAFVLIGY